MAFNHYLHHIKKCLLFSAGTFCLCLFLACNQSPDPDSREPIQEKTILPPKDDTSSEQLIDTFSLEGFEGEVISSSLYPAVHIHDLLSDIEATGTLFEKDMAYASKENVTGEVLYPCEKCLVRTWVASAMISIQEELNSKGYYLKIFDCYRPHSVQKALWNKVSDKRYVASPKKGSMHNRGLAVDVTITDKNLTELDMGSEFDEFGEASHYSYPGLTEEQRTNRRLLRDVMSRHGFTGISSEWWHFSYNKKGRHPMLDLFWECD